MTQLKKTARIPAQFQSPTTVQSILEDERPRERCLKQGPNCLSLRECLALVLSSGPPGIGCLGVARNILEKPGNFFQTSEQERAFFMAMENAPHLTLEGVPGLGSSGKAKILAMFEFARRYSVFREHRLREARRSRVHLRNIHEKALKKLPRDSICAPKEWLGFIPAYEGGELGEFCLVEKGLRTHLNVDPAELFVQVLSLRPSGFFLVHNHPSGETTPSRADVELTENVKEIAIRFGITLLGHAIVSPVEENWIITG